MSLQLEFSGSPEIQAPRDAIWPRLIDPEFIARSAPAVTSVRTIAPGRFEVAATLSLGPMALPLTVIIELLDLAGPERGRLRATANVSGSAVAITSDIQLTVISPDRTRLTWTAATEVDGPLAMFGATMVEGVARKFTTEFWADFARRVEAEPRPA